MKRILCLILSMLCCLFLFTGCASKTAKLLVSTDFADSALLKQLMQAFHDETGYTIQLDAKSNTDVEKAVKKGDFEAALVMTQSAYTKLTSGEWIGGDVFYNTLYLIGPKNDPASVHNLGHYAVTDVLKHLSITGGKFVHPSLVTALGMQDVTMWLKVDTAATGSQRIIAADDGQQMIKAASDQSAYALTTRQNWAKFGAQYTNLKVLLSGIPGMMDQYTILAKKINTKPNAAQAFCQWMMGQKAKSIVQSFFEANATVPAFESNIPAQ